VRTSRIIGVVAAASLVVLSACSSSSKSSSSNATGTTPTTASSAAALTAAQAATAQAEQGTNRQVDPTPRAAVKGKHVVVISAGQASISSMVPSDGAMNAGKALGWQMDLYDAKLNPANYAPLVRQAIAAHADGIILDAIDCDTVQQPLAEAKAAHIFVVPMYAFDCTDVQAGHGPTAYFSSQINFGSKANANLDGFAESYGADQANYIIASSNNTAQVIDIQDPEFTVLYWTLKGFNDVINASGGSKIVDTLNITSADILNPPALVAKIQAEILRFPNANWIKSPYTYATVLGIVPALGSRAGSLHVMGGEGFAPETDEIRAGKVTAVNIISSDWTGWAAADTMNSLFLNQQPVDSGIGWTIADATHNLPAASTNFAPPVDYQSQYKKAWGVG
jgi:ribose transport system substrate-binding protein